MNAIFDSGLLWWITAIDVPVTSGLFWFIMRTRNECNAVINNLRDQLATFKIEVARHYASTAEMKDLEKRIVGHLLRIENKLDVTALKTESLKAKENMTHD